MSVKLSMLDWKVLLGHINTALLLTVNTRFFEDTLELRPWKVFEMVHCASVEKGNNTIDQDFI